ncbi:MAG: amidohydrolase [Clostridiales bacterium]|nr:amidohydrolase [Clostridiales bacterium]
MHELLSAADASRVAADRRYLHAHAETGFDLPETFAYVWQRLTDMGLMPKKCGQCGIIADIGAGEDGILLRADMDALPIREAADVPFASENGCMHACGHDLHTAMLLEAARLLKARENELNGRVRLMFQPAEEPLLGASDMLQNGLLEGMNIRAAFMIHVLTNLALPAGSVIVSSPGVSAPAAGMFEIRIQGKGCHGAMPHTGVDPITIAAHTVLNLQQIQTRELSLSQSCALTIGMLQSGDTANVIPDSALLRGSLRAFDDETHQYLVRRVEEIARSTAELFGGSAETLMLGGAPTLVNDEALSRSTLAALRELLGEQCVLLSHELGGDAKKSSGSEDFANISHAVPSLMVALAAGEPDKGYVFPAHHPKTRFDEAVLPIGAAVYAAMAIRALG